MSNTQRPPQGNQSNSPWSRQDPQWRPQQFQDAASRDPRQPFGQPPVGNPTPAQSWEPEPPRRGGSKVWLIAGAVAVIIAIVIGAQFFGGPAPSPTAADSPSAAAPEPTATRTGNYIPFEGNGDGTFEIVSSKWASDTELNLRIRVEVTTGEYGFGVFAFTNETRDSFDPVDPRSFTATAEHPFEGDVQFIMPRGDSTIVLTTPSGRFALNALPVSG